MFDNEKKISWWILPIVVVLGSVIGLFFEYFVSPLYLLGFRLGSLHIGYILIFLLSLEIFLGIGGRKEFFAIGFFLGVISQAVGCYFGTGGQTVFGTDIPWIYPLISTLSIVVITSLIGIIASGWYITPTWHVATNRWRFGGSFLLISIFCFFRISQIVFLKMGVSNESRSLFVYGVEIHHLIIGLILSLFFLPLCFAGPKKTKNSSFKRFLVLFITGLIADQVTYFFIPELTDRAYFGGFSFFGGLVATVLGVLWYVARKGGFLERAR